MKPPNYRLIDPRVQISPKVLKNSHSSTALSGRFSGPRSLVELIPAGTLRLEQFKRPYPRTLKKPLR